MQSCPKNELRNFGGLSTAAGSKLREKRAVPAIEGKTWNHPVLASDVLLVRNGQPAQRENHIE